MGTQERPLSGSTNGTGICAGYPRGDSVQNSAVCSVPEIGSIMWEASLMERNKAYLID